jgi:hypothetical protein
VHPTLSVGDEINAIRSTGGGGRATNGKDGAIVSCEVSKTDSGFTIAGSLKAGTIQDNFTTGEPYTQRFEITATFPKFEPGAGGEAEIFTNDTYTQRGYTGKDCTLTVKDLGPDGEGGAIWATFVCDELTDPGTPDSLCRLEGTMVFENCDK